MRKFAVSVLFTVLVMGLSLPGFASGSWFIQDGSAAEDNITATVTPGSTDQVLGRFRINSNLTFYNLLGTTVTLSNARTGLSNIKLWTSTTATFPIDALQFGSTVTADPGASPMEFMGNQAAPFGDTYVFLTADVANGATGDVMGNLDYIWTTGAFVFGFAPGDDFSNGSVALPVSVSAFSAE